MTNKKIKHPKQIEEGREKSLREKLLKAEKLERECEKRTPEILNNPKLLINIINEVQKEVAGEEDTITAEIIIATTRLVKDAIPESKNLFLSDITGIGKDHTTEKTLEVIIPKPNHLHVTKMSNESFTYWHANEPGWNWDDKLIHFEDITQSLLNTSTFKVMASGGSNAVVVKDQKTIEIPINGKPVMILTSHHVNPEDEALRRFPIGGCDETKEQTTRIFEKISKKYTKRNENEPDIIFRYAVKNLKPYSVVIPYAELIQYFFPKDILMRTHFHRFLNYICASAVLHQDQREKTENNELITTPDDYMIARMVLIYTTSNPKMIPMSKEYRDLLDILKENINPMTVDDLFQKCAHSKKWLYEHLPQLVNTGLIVKGSIFQENANKTVVTYQYDPTENVQAIPTWQGIGNKIEKVVEKTENTEKTKIEVTGENDIEKWFLRNGLKPKILKKGGVMLVFSGWKIPFNREVFSVFTIFSNYLRERDEKRYKKYYQERQEKENYQENNKKLENFDKKPQIDKIKELQDYFDKCVEKGHSELSYTLLCDQFDPDFIEECKKRKIIISHPKGGYVLNE